MKLYEIVDEENILSIGCLIYYEKESSFIIELQENLDEWTAPLLFTSYVKKNIYTIPKDISLLWIQERIIPIGRQNINDILNNHKLKSYDEMKFLEISEGRCSQDSMYVRKIDEIPKYVIKRQQKNIVDVVILKKNNILCFFADGSTKKIDLNELLDAEGIDKIIKNEGLFETGKVSLGGYGVIFNDSIEIPANRLYNSGIEVPLSLEDFKQFLKKNVYDTTKSCEVLECSRQNMAYLVKQKLIYPIKEETKGNLYIKGDIEKLRW